ncbi:MAG: DUF1700 domain-containing protein [Collinsella sp.]|nr:DUF1700 domain-containing protein [Collinsella sp.]
MDKAAFLVRLQKNIGMLDDDEQKDIIDEYSQYIDMKVADGMSEAEAIENFGDFDDFVREVLSAYHVKAPFDQASASASSLTEEDPVDGIARAGAGIAVRVAAAAKDGARHLGEATAGLAGKASEVVRAAVSHGGSSNDMPADSEDDMDDDGVPAGGSGVGRRAKAEKMGLRGAIVLVAHACWRACKVCARWAWNLAVVCASAAIALFSLFCLFGLGAGLVLVAQGYPVLGVTIAAGGASVAAMALAYLGTLLFVRRDAHVDPAVDQDASELGGHGGFPNGGGSDQGDSESSLVPRQRDPELTDGSEPTTSLAVPGQTIPSPDWIDGPTLPLGGQGGANYA